jgi:uncharacterized Tic20 family protein
MDDEEQDTPDVVDVSTIELKNFRDTALIYTSIFLILFCASIILGNQLNTHIPQISLHPFLQLLLGLILILLLLTTSKYVVSKLN